MSILVGIINGIIFALRVLLITFGIFFLAGIFSNEQACAQLKKALSKFFTVVKTAIMGLLKMLYEELTGNVLPEHMVNTMMILNIDEVNMLVRRFDRRPYDSPALEGYLPNSNGILWVNIIALWLAPEYRDLTHEQLSKMACHVITTFFMETRQCGVQIFVKVATPQRLYFAIPLSEAGRKFLEKQDLEQKKSITDNVRDFSETFVEEIPPLDNMEENDDYWL